MASEIRSERKVWPAIDFAEWATLLLLREIRKPFVADIWGVQYHPQIGVNLATGAADAVYSILFGMSHNVGTHKGTHDVAKTTPALGLPQYLEHIEQFHQREVGTNYAWILPMKTTTLWLPVPMRVAGPQVANVTNLTDESALQFAVTLWYESVKVSEEEWQEVWTRTVKLDLSEAPAS